MLHSLWHEGRAEREDHRPGPRDGLLD
eukprot:SAG22_NODE_12758_length_430_cov_1.012085_1_plen_26_part_10